MHDTPIFMPLCGGGEIAILMPFPTEGARNANTSPLSGEFRDKHNAKQCPTGNRPRAAMRILYAHWRGNASVNSGKRQMLQLSKNRKGGFISAWSGNTRYGFMPQGAVKLIN